MKKILSTLCMGISVAVCFTSCDKNFEQVNTNPNATTSPTPAYIFTKAQYDGAKSNLLLLLGTMQYTTSFNDVAGFGSKYLASQSQQSAGGFVSYPNEINEIGEVIRAVNTNPDQVNLLSAARIWRAYCFSRLTDLYGDIPYSQAGKAFTDGVFAPAYDAQKDIYADLLKELDQATQAFATGKPTFGNADLLYGGDITKWKKFAFSLMLRLGMRMTKVDAAMAETWVKKAIAGGVILADADIAKVPYVGGQDINTNPTALTLFRGDYSQADGYSNTEGGKYQENFINYLKNNKDPRLAVFSVVYTGTITPKNRVADTSFALQKGMPATFGVSPGQALFSTYSEPNQKTVLLQTSPLLVYTVAETQFLLAEAALRGWFAGSASTLYADGIRASMRQWAIIAGAAGTISTLQTETYIKYHPLSTTGTFAQQMEQIYTQLWVGLFPDAQETYASYRRTGYPALVPNNYPGNATAGRIPRRMLYPVSEQILNGTNLSAANARQGADDFMTRIWWDRP